MLGLVLEGGGTKGSYQIGVYEALVEEGIEIDGVAGTSIGSLNGALIVQGDYKEAKKLWENIDYSMIISASEEEISRLENLKPGIKDLPFIGGKIKDIIKEGGLDISPLKELIASYIDEDKIRKSNKDFGIVTVNISDLKPVEIFIEDIPKGNLANYLLASSYLPIFKFEKMGGNFYIDGAFHDNLPFNMLREKGYNKFILVRIFGTGLVKKIDIDEEDYIIIQPREDLGGSLECNPERSKYNMKLGYYDTLKVLRGLLGNKYYLDYKGDRDKFFEIFSSLEKNKIKKIGKILNIEGGDEKRLLFENIIPRLASYLDLNKDYSYETVFLGILEKKAINCNIDRFKVYRLEEFIALVRQSKLISKEESQGILGVIKDKVSSLSILNKEESILKIGDILFSNKD